MCHPIWSVILLYSWLNKSWLTNFVYHSYDSYRWCDLQKYKFKWRYDRPSANFKLSKIKLTPHPPPKKIAELQRDSSPWLLCYCCNALTNWAIKTHTLRAGQFVEFILTDERNEIKHKDDVSCRNTNLNEDMIIAVVITISEIAN